MVNRQRIIALVFMVFIGAMLLYVSLINSVEPAINKDEANGFKFILDILHRANINALLDDIKTYIGLISVGLGVFIYAGKKGK